MCAATTWLAYRRTPLDFLHDLDPAFPSEGSGGIVIPDADLPLTREAVTDGRGEPAA